MWTESHISQLGPDWHPHRERQQQLLDRLHRALHGTAARSGRWVSTGPQDLTHPNMDQGSEIPACLRRILGSPTAVILSKWSNPPFSSPVGLADCVLALGFEKMERGSLSAKVWNTFPSNVKPWPYFPLIILMNVYFIYCIYSSLWTGPIPWTNTWRWWSTAMGWLLLQLLRRCLAMPEENIWRNMVLAGHVPRGYAAASSLA